MTQAAIDPKNPPAVVVWTDGKITWTGITGFLLDAERRFVSSAMDRHLRMPARYARPMCIVRLKAMK